MKHKFIYLTLFTIIVLVTLLGNLFLLPEKQGNFLWYILYIPMLISLLGLFSTTMTIKKILIWTVISIPIFLFCSFQFNLPILFKLIAIVVGGGISCGFLWLMQKKN
jgi:hypothetical protein